MAYKLRVKSLSGLFSSNPFHTKICWQWLIVREPALQKNNFVPPPLQKRFDTLFWKKNIIQTWLGWVSSSARGPWHTFFDVLRGTPLDILRQFSYLKTGGGVTIILISQICNTSGTPNFISKTVRYLFSNFWSKNKHFYSGI